MTERMNNMTLISGLSVNLKRLFLILLVFLILPVARAGKSERLYKKAKAASLLFAKKESAGRATKFKMDSLLLGNGGKIVTLQMSPTFAEIPYRDETVRQFYADYRELLGRKFRKSTLTISSMNKEISELVPNMYREDQTRTDRSRLTVPGNAMPQVVRNISAGNNFTSGLTNRNLALWQSHGWYYENTLDRWEWQRARDFLTVEDLWTMSFVVPYLTPMLENAGATVWLPRERDFNAKEVIADQERCTPGTEYKESGPGWQSSALPGFALKYPFLLDGENPFTFGHSRFVTARQNADAGVEYLPEIPAKGNYAVYVSYSRDENNVKDASYTVHHAGGVTRFRVNQSIGGGTWIYLGTFLFEKGRNPEIGKVVLDNGSSEPGKLVSADAVRFGGGSGNIARGREEQLKTLFALRESKGWEIDSAAWIPFTSQRPRYQEGARYYLQNAGFPDSMVYSLNRIKVDYSNRGPDAALYAARESGKEDYKDDYMCRGEWVNYLMGDPKGPTKYPHAKGLGVPVDMSLGFHTDAGTTKDSSIIGTLVIYETSFERDTFPGGQSKWASRDLADIIQTQVVEDLRKLHKADWTRRGMWNKRYFEAARPKVPAVLSELLSHQNFADMYLAQDPRFKFDVCRSYYKGILKFIASQNGYPYVVQPLPVKGFGMKRNGNNLILSWSQVPDPLEPTAMPTAYKIYKRTEAGGFDNGTLVKDSLVTYSDLVPGTIYSFRVTALNSGGESFPSEILSCSLPVGGSGTALIVNAFDRISAPAAFDNGREAGFRVSDDEGVAYLENVAFIGEQYDFDRNSPWLDDDACGFGSSYGDQETRILPGNRFDYPFVHGKSLKTNGLGFISMSREFFEKQPVDFASFSLVDIIFGKEKTTRQLFGVQGNAFTLLTPAMREAISRAAGKEGAKILISGTCVGSDLSLCGDSVAKKFASGVLHYTHRTSHASKSGMICTVNSLKKGNAEQYGYINSWHPSIYRVESPDAIEPAGKDSEVLFRYFGDNKSAATWYHGKYQAVVMGIPIETIATDGERDALFGQLLRLMNRKQ